MNCVLTRRQDGRVGFLDVSGTSMVTLKMRVAVKSHVRESAQTVSGIACVGSLAPSSEINREST